MDQQKVDLFIMTNGKYFDSAQIYVIKDHLLRLDDAKWAVVQSISFTDPTISIVVSLLAGSFGIDRFIIGDTGLGVAKLLTCGGFGIWTIIDWFLIMGVTKEKNLQKLQMVF